MAKVVRFDLSSLPKSVKTKEGFIKTDAVVTRTGIFIYHNEDGTVRRELRDHREVFNRDSLETMKMIPLTNDHPQTETKLLTPENVKQFQVGFTGENVRADGENVRIPVSLTAKEAVDAYENGKRGLSLGYECDLVDESGDYDGMRFDCKQTNIRYNHLAIVNSPRAGENARLDSVDIDNTNDVESLTHKQKEQHMPKVTLDGIEYEAAPEVINALTKAIARADTAEVSIKTAKTEADKNAADRDSQKARADALEAEKAKMPEQISAAVAARIDLERKATIVLDEKDREGLDKLTDVDIKKKVILSVFKDAKLGNVSADYLGARFDSAVEMSDKVKRDTAMADQRAKSGLAAGGHADSTGTNEHASVEKSEKSYQSGVKEAWKSKTDGCDGSKSMKDKNIGSMSRK